MSLFWETSYNTYIFLFNVGRGISIFIRTPLNHGIIYDFGSSDEFSPSDFIKNNILPNLTSYNSYKIAQTIISHPHFDHISDIKCLTIPNIMKSPFYAILHTCPHDKSGDEKINWERITNPDEAADEIELYKSIYANRELPLQTIDFKNYNQYFPNCLYGIYYIKPPIVSDLFPYDDQEYSNGISIVLYYYHHPHSILIPGDINPVCIKYILDDKKGVEKRLTLFAKKLYLKHPTWHYETSDQPSLAQLLKKKKLTILIAPHHGLESGYSEDLYKLLNGRRPDIVAISEKRHVNCNDGSISNNYQNNNGANGLQVNINGKVETRYSISTVNNQHMLFIFDSSKSSPKIYLNQSPEELLQYLY